MATIVTSSDDPEPHDAPLAHEVGEHEAKLQLHSSVLASLTGEVERIKNAISDAESRLDRFASESANFVTHESVSSVREQVESLASQVEQIAEKAVEEPEKVVGEIIPADPPEKVEDAPEKTDSFAAKVHRFLA